MSKVLLFGDTESTDFPIWKQPSGISTQPHLVEIAGILADSESHEVIQEFSEIIRPDGWVSSPGALEAHGITHEQAMDEGIPEKEAVEIYMDMWNTCDMRVFHNTTFDNRMIRIALSRYFPKEVRDSFKEGAYFCTCVKGGKAKVKKGLDKKWPTLEEALNIFCDKEISDAHRALSDTRHCMEVFWPIYELVGE